jgi:hypothetical protein
MARSWRSEDGQGIFDMGAFPKALISGTASDRSNDLAEE